MVQICYNASSQSYKHYSNNKSLFHQEELEEPTFNWCIRTVQEFKARFLDKTSSVYRQRLRLVSLETAVTPCSCEDEPHKWGMVGMCSTIVAHKKNHLIRGTPGGAFLFKCIQLHSNMCCNNVGVNVIHTCSRNTGWNISNYANFKLLHFFFVLQHVENPAWGCLISPTMTYVKFNKSFPW